MGTACSYELAIMDMPDNVDIETLMFRAYRIAPETKVFLTEVGGPTGNDGPWNSIINDFLAISAHFTDTTFYIDETIQYDGESQTKYVFNAGRYKSVEPVMMWPEFDSVPWS
jgi:hypothetical protein